MLKKEESVSSKVSQPESYGARIHSYASLSASVLVILFQKLILSIIRLLFQIEKENQPSNRQWVASWL